MGDQAEADRARKEVKVMYDTILTDGWDGDWFVRAYDAYSNKVGSKECKEGQIYIEPQGMCVMAGIGKESGEAAKALAEHYAENGKAAEAQAISAALKKYHPDKY